MEELINKAKNGDIDAYTEAFMSLRVDLEKIALTKLKDKNYLEDIIQDVYYKAYKSLYKLKDSRKFREWLFTILRNECRNNNKYRSYRLEADIESLEEILENSSAINPENAISFEAMIKDLTEEEQKLLKLKFEESYTNKEIAEKLGVPYNTVKSKILRAVKRISIVLIALVMLSGFTVLAVFVIKQIRAHFTTSLNAINTAVENNYVQEIDSDFVYDNGIGIKVDAIVLDDQNLNISFVYDIQDEEKYGEINGIRLKDYVIKSDNEILFDSKIDEEQLSEKSRQYIDNLEINEEKYANSILISTIKDFPKTSDLSIEIKDIRINTNKEDFYVQGDWKIVHEISNKLLQRENVVYTMDSNIYSENGNGVLTETSIQFSIKLNVEDEINNFEEIALYSNYGNEFECIGGKFSLEDKYLKIVFDLSKYMKNIDELTLEIPRDNEENIIIKFRRDQ